MKFHQLSTSLSIIQCSGKKYSHQNEIEIIDQFLNYSVFRNEHCMDK